MLYRHNTTYIPRRAYDLSIIANITLFLILSVNVIDKLAIKWQYDSDMEYRDSIMRPVLSITTIRTEYRDKEIPQENIDTWVGEYADKYANQSKPSSYLRYQLHCLANKESGHRYDDHEKCGDNGKSCGLYQYRKPTWEMFRKEMIKKGLVTEIGTLWNNEQAVETTAYALSQGYDNHWGPIVNKGSCL